MVPLRFWLWDPLLGICKSTSINHCGMLISRFSGYFWASPTNHLWIPANFKCHLDTTQKQSLRKSHDRPALVSWATLVWNSRRISRMSKSCSYDPSSLNWSTLCQTIMFQTCMSVAWELKLIFHELFSEFHFKVVMPYVQLHLHSSSSPKLQHQEPWRRSIGKPLPQSNGSIYVNIQGILQ